MPTAAKLFAAFSLGLVAYIASELFKPTQPEGMDFGYFSLLNASYGAIIGWKIIGTRVGMGIMRAINNGITGMLAMVLVCLFVNSCRLMILKSIDGRYRSTTEAILSIFDMMLEYGLLLFSPPIITTLIVGALFSGLLAESVSRRWS